MNKKLTDRQLEDAKALYMDYKSLAKIASAIGCKKSAIAYHAQKKDGWRSERVLRSTELAAEFSESKLKRMNSTFSSGFAAVEEWMRIKSADPGELKTHEVKTMLTVIEQMDKISRLDAGSPTDIIAETRPMDVKEALQKIKTADPFMVDADFKEIENDEEENDEAITVQD